MALDPDATEPYDESDAEDRLYIAAGRMGLWVMEADQAETHLDLAIALIDDAPGTSPAYQSSRR